MTAPIRVLYVDDNPFDRDLVRDALTATDREFTVTETTNRSELEAALESGRFDCVLSDLNILGYSGLDVYEAVMTRTPGLPVVILTGTGSEELAVEAMKRGVSDYILKTPKHILRLPYSLAAVVEKARLAAKHRQASERIRELAERISLATRAAGIGIWDFDPEAGALCWDETVCRLYGVDRAAFTGGLADWKARLHPDDAAAAETGFLAAAAAGSAWESEFRIRRPDGVVRTVRSQATFLPRSSGRPSRLLGVTWDISDYRNAVDTAEVAKAAAQSANRAKSRFLANISHELWTPMNSIIGFSEMMLNTETDAEHREHLGLILGAGRSLLRIFQDVLAISRSDTEPFSPQPVLFDLENEIEHSAALFRAEAIRKGLEFTAVCAPDVPRKLHGDRILLRQILVTLLSNAVKFTDRGTVSLEVTVAGPGPSSADITFRITDTGVGIRPENRARVFEPFEQEDNSAARRFDGTGLGLAIARKLVGRLGGSIGFVSEPGAGSNFHFTVRFAIHETASDARPTFRE